MHRWLVILTLLCIFAPFSGLTKPIDAEISHRLIEIDSDFTGTELIMFGARDDAGDIVMVVRGPSKPYVVRKKERVMGIWVSKRQRVFPQVEEFYAIASSKPLASIKNDHLLELLNIGVDNQAFMLPLDNQAFRQALLHAMQEQGLYDKENGEIRFKGGRLFHTAVEFPDNIARGHYTVEIYLFSDGTLTGMQSVPLVVRKTGFDAFLYDLAYHSSVLYGLLAIVLALVAGWLANIIFRR